MTECLDDDAGREQDEDLNEHQDFGQSKDLPPQAGQDEGGEKMAEGREVREHVPGASYVIYGRIEGKQESGLQVPEDDADKNERRNRGGKHLTRYPGSRGPKGSEKAGCSGHPDASGRKNGTE